MQVAMVTISYIGLSIILPKFWTLTSLDFQVELVYWVKVLLVTN